MTEPLTGHVALVTGASGGIGAAICRELAAQGAALALAYGGNARPAERLAVELRSHGARAVALGADLAAPDGPQELVAGAVAALGPVDILVANHGVATQVPWPEIDAETFDHTLAVNLRAPFLLAQAVLPGMAERGFGRILFVSSTAALRGGVIGPHYAASKAGLHGLAYYLAARAADRGVTVNVIAPGFIDTAMLPADRGELAAGIPVGRVGRPEEVADLALAIIRNGYLTGHVLPLDGGMHPG